MPPDRLYSPRDEDDYDRPRRRRRRYDEDDSDDPPRRPRRRRKAGPGPGVWVALVGGVLATVFLAVVVVVLLSGGGGRDGGGGVGVDSGDVDPEAGGWRPGNVVANLHEFKTHDRIAEKLGPGRPLSADEAKRTVIQETDEAGRVKSRKSVHEYIGSTGATYYHWQTRGEDLYVAFPDPGQRFGTVRAVWAGRQGQTVSVMTSSA
jgi:hypothetical protein